MTEEETKQQMGLFDVVPVPGKKPAVKAKSIRAKGNKQKVIVKQPVKVTEKKNVSGLVPEGDVRLTANIRQDLHLKLKIAAAHRRTTIGEIIEELVQKYLE